MNESAKPFWDARDLLLRYRNDYHNALRHFRWPELSAFNWALDYFDSFASGNCQLGLIIDSETGISSMTFDELVDNSSRLANHLQTLGIRRGDSVLIMLGNEIPLWLAILACMKIGAVVIPTSLLLSNDDLANRIERGRVHHLIVAQDQTYKFAGVDRAITRIVSGSANGWREFDEYKSASARFVPTVPTLPSDPLFLYFTSGTTSDPKLVVHSHSSYPIGNLTTMYWIGLRPGDVHINISSPGWANHAWNCFFAPWSAGSTVLALNRPRFNAKTLLSILEKHSVTVLSAPPTVWRMLIQEDLAACRHNLAELVSAGEPLNPEVIERVRKAWGLTIRDGYGQTETTAIVGNTPGQPVRTGSMGRVLPGYRIELLDKADDSEGELAVCLDPSPLGMMEGYLNPDGTITSLAGEFHRTGDVVSMTEDGYITFIGRADDVFKASDYRISPFELESVLLEHVSVAEAAVIPAHDPLRAAVPKAFIALCAGCSPDRETAYRIFRHVQERTSPFKRVRRIQFGSLPKTSSGKIQRLVLRREEENCHGRRPHEFYETDFPDLA